VNTCQLLPAVRALLSQYPRAARLSAEQVAGLLWILLYVPEPDHEGPPAAFEIENALEVLDIDIGRGMAA
jgi:hypothetical protein